MQTLVGVVGGTGVGERLSALGGVPLHVPTAEGVVRGRLLERDGVDLFLLSRHSSGHKVPPHRVNYKGMALALKALGSRACLSTAAVGSVRAEWGPGTLVACSDFLDFTFRNITLFDRTVVHRDFTEPFGPRSRKAILDSARELGLAVEEKGIYLCGNGPRYETPHEICLYRDFGADLVGMTAASEAIVMREAEIDYGCLAIVTNLAAGMSGAELNHEEVVDEMNKSGEKAVAILLNAAMQLAATA